MTLTINIFETGYKKWGGGGRVPFTSNQPVRSHQGNSKIVTVETHTKYGVIYLGRIMVGGGGGEGGITLNELRRQKGERRQVREGLAAEKINHSATDRVALTYIPAQLTHKAYV